MAKTNGDSWHVRASIGTELGPIDTDTLLTMADGGLLCEGDVVRKVSESEWRTLPIVLSNLRSTLSPVLVSPAESPPPMKSATDDQVSDRIVVPQPITNLKGKSQARSKPLPGWQEPSSAEARQASLMQNSPRHDDEEVKLPSDSESATSLLDSWKDQRRETIDRLLTKVAEREAIAVINSESDIEDFDKVSLAFDEPDRVGTSPADGESSEKHPAPEAIPPVKQESFVEMRDRWRRSLPSWPVVTAFVFIAGLVITNWPTSISQSRTIARLQAMYVKLERHRFHPQDRTGMEDFSRAAIAELDELIPQLKERASIKDYDSMVLLWIARDCLLPILRSPRIRNTKSERDLLMLFTAWDKRHETTYAVMPDPDAEP